jgi:hypothetical protein
MTRTAAAWEILYELPREVWADNIDAALNWSITLPPEGTGALQDRAEGLPVFAGN